MWLTSEHTTIRSRIGAPACGARSGGVALPDSYAARVVHDAGPSVDIGVSRLGTGLVVHTSRQQARCRSSWATPTAEGSGTGTGSVTSSRHQSRHQPRARRWRCEARGDRAGSIPIQLGRRRERDSHSTPRWLGHGPMPVPVHGHFDSSPSLRLYLDDGIWHCFGCGSRGDVVEWVSPDRGSGLGRSHPNT